MGFPFFATRCIATVGAVLIMIACEGAPKAEVTPAAAASILRLDPALDSIVPQSAQVEKLAGGFQFIEGPLWFKAGHLWFSNVTGDVVRQWSPEGGVTEDFEAGRLRRE